jgi:sterol 14-demethylase
MTFLVGPEAQAVFFRANDQQASPKEAYQFMVPVFGKGVVYDSPIEVMYEQLKFVKNGLVPAQLKRDVDYVLAIIDKFTADWGNEGDIANVLFEMNRLTILTATRCLMGVEIHDQMWGEQAGSFAHLYHDLEGGILPISFFFPNLPIPAFKKRDRAREAIVRVFSGIIKARRQKGTTSDDVLQILMDAVYKDGTTMTDDNIAGLLIGVLFAGQHTSSITGTWTLLFLLKNPEYLAKVMKEQQEVLAPDGKHGGKLTFEALKDMVHLEFAVRETLRIYPPLIHLMRMVKEPLQYKDFVIPPGHLVCVSGGMSHQLDSTFPDAATWRPERWFEFPDGAGIPPKHSFLAFGGGRHGCPGEPFAILQIKTIFSVLLRRYDLTLGKPDMPPPDYTAMVVGPVPPVPIHYRVKTSK